MDVACADGKLRPPMAGEWQDIALAYACTVETVRRLVARMLIHGDIERSDIKVCPEKVSFHRSAEPIAEFGLNGQKA